MILWSTFAGALVFQYRPFAPEAEECRRRSRVKIMSPTFSTCSRHTRADGKWALSSQISESEHANHWRSMFVMLDLNHDSIIVPALGADDGDVPHACLDAGLCRESAWPLRRESGEPWTDIDTTGASNVAASAPFPQRPTGSPSTPPDSGSPFPKIPADPRTAARALP